MNNDSAPHHSKSDSDGTQSQARSEEFAILKELYTHVHKEMMDFRTVGLSAATLYATFTAAVFGWLLSASGSSPRPTGNFVSLTTIGLIVTIFMGFYFWRVGVFFRDAAGVINKIETLWGAFAQNRFGPQDRLEQLWKRHERTTILFPERWEDFGTRKWWEPIFLYTKILLFLVGVSFATLLLQFSPHVGPMIRAVLPAPLIPL